MQLNRTIETSDRVLIPAGTKLQFSNGIAKYNGHPVERNKIPIEAIVGHKGPFMNACVATLINDCMRFQRDVRKTAFKDFHHCIAYGNNLIVYIWDTREVVDVISGLNSGAKPNVHSKTLVSKTTGERLTQVTGRDRHGWAKSLYDMLLLPKYHRPDNGLPLVTKRQDWQDAIAPLNKLAIKALMAFESANPEDDINTAQKLDAIAKFVQSCTQFEVKVVKGDVIVLAEERNNGNWQSKTVLANAKILKEAIADRLDCMVEELDNLVVPAWVSDTKGTASGIKCKLQLYNLIERCSTALERDFTDEERKVLAASGAAMPDGSYPIENVDDLENAIKAFGRTGSDKEETKQHIIKRAKELNAIDKLPESWLVANEQVYGNGLGNGIHIHRYTVLEPALRRYGKMPVAEPWLHAGIVFDKNDKCYAVVYIWDTRKVIADVELPKEAAFAIIDFAIKERSGAVDNGKKLQGGSTGARAANNYLH